MPGRGRRRGESFSAQAVARAARDENGGSGEGLLASQCQVQEVGRDTEQTGERLLYVSWIKDGDQSRIGRERDDHLCLARSSFRWGGQPSGCLLSERSGSVPRRLLSRRARHAAARLAGQAPPGQHLSCMLAPLPGERNENRADLIRAPPNCGSQVPAAPAQSRRFDCE